MRERTSILRKISDYKSKNRDREQKRSKIYYERHRTRIVERVKIYLRQKREQTLIKRATPSWTSLELIDAVYQECERLKIGMPDLNLRVTHIIPLAGRIVCGLHVIDNVKIVSETFDLARPNRFTYRDQEMESERHFKWLQQQGLA